MAEALDFCDKDDGTFWMEFYMVCARPPHPQRVFARGKLFRLGIASVARVLAGDNKEHDAGGQWADLFTSLTICSTAQAVAKATELGYSLGRSGGVHRAPRTRAITRSMQGDQSRERKATTSFSSVHILDTIDSDEEVPLGYTGDDVQISIDTR
eukprot:COSAG01_NODE_392_length_17668_cov_5.382264_17_plen_154_part_00